MQWYVVKFLPIQTEGNVEPKKIGQFFVCKYIYPHNHNLPPLWMNGRRTMALILDMICLNFAHQIQQPIRKLRILNFQEFSGILQPIRLLQTKINYILTNMTSMFKKSVNIWIRSLVFGFCLKQLKFNCW